MAWRGVILGGGFGGLYTPLLPGAAGGTLEPRHVEVPLHAFGFKTLSEAIALRNRREQTLEHAESIEDDEARSSLPTYVFVGAGYAGVEGLAELQDFAKDVLGQLGHPPPLAAAGGLSEQSAGGTAPDGSRRPEDANVR
jgi:hypothetical protein